MLSLLSFLELIAFYLQILSLYLNYRQSIKLHFAMGCATGKTRETDKVLLQKYDDTISKITPEQLHILKIIYFDLALRNSHKKIEKETFFAFFHKNGLWGQKLFRDFDFDGSGFVCLEEFIFNLARMIKATKQTKIFWLYEFFAFGNKDQQSGIIYADFIRVLYNYSKFELKKMLQAEYLSVHELKQQLLDVLEQLNQKNKNDGKDGKDEQICLQMNEKSQSVYGSNIMHLLNIKRTDKNKYQFSSFIGKPSIKNSNTTRNKLNESSNQSDNEQYQTKKSFEINDNNVDRNQSSLLTKDPDSMKELIKNRKGNKKQSGVLVQLQNKKFVIKASSYHALVKKIGGLIFTHFGIDKKNGRLSQHQFVEWITQHPQLYESYYKGFNQDIWQIKDGKLGYLGKTPQIQTIANYYGQLFENGQLTSKEIVKPCKVFLQGSLMFISDEDSKEKLYNVIFLQGLEIRQVKQEKLGYGIQIKHKHNIYPKKNIFFKSQYQCMKWMSHLKEFKGFNVHDKYEMGLRIGAGRYSIVYECTDRNNKLRYAMKEIDTFKLTHQQKSIISHESNIMSDFDHPNLLKFRETIKAKHKIYIITELVEGKDLMQYVKDKDYLTEAQTAQIAKQIISGVNYIHRLGIVHRDLKPENIMIESNGAQNELKVKLIDFGFANSIDNLEFLNQQDIVVGTPNYIAPEVYLKHKITEKADIFSLGTIIYFMLSGDLPFNSDNLEFLIQRTLSQKVQFVGKRWMKVSRQAKNLIQRMLQVEPKQRITLRDALNHQWFKIPKISQRQAETAEQKQQVIVGSRKIFLY